MRPCQQARRAHRERCAPAPQVVEELVRLLRFEQPAWGTRRIAQVLARLRVAVSRSSVQRLVRRKPRRPATAGPSSAIGRVHAGDQARLANHVWLIDFTTWTLFFGLLEIHVGAVLDAFSRSILSIGIRRGRPTSRWACELVRSAIRVARAAPKRMITDEGAQLRSRGFRRLLRGAGIARRYGAVDEHGSIAKIERFWRTLKREWWVPATVLWFAPRLAARGLRSWTRWYNGHRPHQGLGGRTPDEVRRGRMVRADGPHADRTDSASRAFELATRVRARRRRPADADLESPLRGVARERLAYRLRAAVSCPDSESS